MLLYREKKCSLISLLFMVLFNFLNKICTSILNFSGVIIQQWSIISRYV